MPNKGQQKGMSQERLSGTVKSWNGSKGYGFITCDQFAGDVFFARTELPAEAREVRGTFLEGRTVSFEAHEGPDGRAKASNVQIVLVEGQPLAGMIKSYSEQNRYGFLTSSSLSDDVRFQATDLPPMAHGANLKGKLVTFEMQQLADGKLRVTKMTFQTSRMATELGATFGGYGHGYGDGYGNGYGGVPYMPAQPRGGYRNYGPPALANAPHMGGGKLMGIVKSFSDRNGYGFINTPGQIQDIKFGKADLLVETVSSGTPVSFIPNISADGRIQARQVQPSSGKRPGSWGAPGTPALANRPYKQQRTGKGSALPLPVKTEDANTGEYHSGTVKSYTPSKGFGFIVCPELSGDIFFMRQVLPDEYQNADLKGTSVTFELGHTPDGKLRAHSVSVP